jgi:hypothetical protein
MGSLHIAGETRKIKAIVLKSCIFNFQPFNELAILWKQFLI